MKTVILAGGLGTRLRPLTQVIPKPLLPIGEQSVLEITVQGLKASGFRDIVMATSYKSHLFESYFGDGSRWNVKISYSREKKRLGTAGPLKLVQAGIKKPFLVINGDILTNLNFRKLAKYHADNGAKLTVVTKVVTTPLHYGVVKSRGRQVIKLEEKPTEMKVLLKADNEVEYGKVVDVMDLIKNANIELLGLITEQKTGT